MINNIKQTAVQQLIYDLKNIDMSIFNEHHCQKYLDLEKQQIENAYYSGYENNDLFKHSTDYYEQTFKKD